MSIRMPRLILLPILLAIGSLTAFAARAEWPSPAQRSGADLPKDRDIAGSIEAAGIYMPEIEGISNYDTGMLEGSLVWNVRLFDGLGLFGKHSIWGLWWSDISMLAFGHEVGARFLCCRLLSFEAAYLGHRAEYEWIDGDAWNAGGVKDHGAEVGAWARFDLLKALRIEPHLLGRYFGEPDGSGGAARYTDDQFVAGGGLRVSIMPIDGHAAVIEMKLLRIYRDHPRDGVDHVTWNVLGEALWRSNLIAGLGVQAGVRLSKNILCGEVPMLELRRSMIDDPMMTAILGLYFSL